MAESHMRENSRWGNNVYAPLSQIVEPQKRAGSYYQ